MDVKINNPDPTTGIGEIVAKGANVMVGYYKNPEATKEAFTEDGWFRTKDLGIFDNDKMLFIKGRLSNMILGPSGENIYPEQIEDVINSHELVAESIVTEDKGRLVALVHFDEAKIKDIFDERDRMVETYQEKIERLLNLYEEKVDLVQKSLYSKKDELLEIIQKKKEDTIKMYNEKKDEATKIFNEKIEKLKKDVHAYVNERVNKSSKISSVEHHPEQFEKTATQKIKRYKYSKKK
jgi:long-chain acyl-CoA synthetase